MGLCLDDIFFIFAGTERQLMEFHTFMNLHIQHLKFHIAMDANKMNFLDILVIQKGDTLTLLCAVRNKSILMNICIM